METQVVFSAVVRLSQEIFSERCNLIFFSANFIRCVSQMLFDKKKTFFEIKLFFVTPMKLYEISWKFLQQIMLFDFS